jgi:N-acetylglucosaminyldiphosphoundecaprenol N-acetyl-beta-D-mannosaminyltransferase
MRVISIDLSPLSFDATIDQLVHFAQTKSGGYTCVANVHMCIEAWQNNSFAKVVNGAKIVTPDGMPLVKAMNWLYKAKQERVAGMDLLPALLKHIELQQFPILFYGGTSEMLDKTKAYLAKNFPGIVKAHFNSPPFRPLTAAEMQQTQSYIAEHDIRLVFVVLGCPKQELFMSQISPNSAAHYIGIGGALPVMLGMQKRAPLWMQKSSLEWLFRLAQEPRRLFRRYFVTNSLYILLLSKQLLLKTLKRPS